MRAIAKSLGRMGVLLLAMVASLHRSGVAADRTPADAAQPRQGGPAVFRAGAATSNVTPMLGAEIIGNFVEPKSTYVHDELHARCLVLDDGKTRLGFVVVDNVGIPREVYDEARKLIDAAGQLSADNVNMSATHTHSATSARGTSRIAQQEPLTEYQRFVARRIADGVARAVHNLEPARIAFGSADEPRPLFNRRYFMKPGVELLNPVGGKDLVKMNPGYNKDIVKPAGPTDPQISFISVKSATDRPIALLANYSLHYVGGVGEQEISADYYGAFCDLIQQRLGADRLDPPFVGILSNGTSGDVNNVNAMGPKPPPRQNYEQIDRVAGWVADAVMKAHASLHWHEAAELRALHSELKLKTRKPTPSQLEHSRQIVAGTVKPASLLESIYARRLIDLQEGPDEISVPLKTFQIGELGVASIPFEVFTQSGLDLKTQSVYQPTFTIELSNGSYGYLPTEQQHQLGGYETWIGTNNVQLDAATRIVDRLLEMFRQMKESGGRASR